MPQKRERKQKLCERDYELLDEENRHTIPCHVCKERVFVKNYTSHCNDLHGVPCTILKAQKNIKVLKDPNPPPSVPQKRGRKQKLCERDY